MKRIQGEASVFEETRTEARRTGQGMDRKMHNTGQQRKQKATVLSTATALLSP